MKEELAKQLAAKYGVEKGYFLAGRLAALAVFFGDKKCVQESVGASRDLEREIEDGSTVCTPEEIL